MSTEVKRVNAKNNTEITWCI